MAYHLSFDRMVSYDSGHPGISFTVELRIGQFGLSVPVKVDTGSTHCLFTETVGRELGIEIGTGEPLTINTVTGSFRSYGHWVTLFSEGFEFDSMLFFAADQSLGRNVLGRFGWLDRMIIGINDYDGKLYLSSYQ